MKFFFANQKIERLCRESKVATKALGALCAKKLQTRLAELTSAVNVADLLQGRPHPLKGRRAGQFALDLYGGTRLIFKPTLQPPPVKADGAIDWTQVSEVHILSAEDYHG